MDSCADPLEHDLARDAAAAAGETRRRAPIDVVAMASKIQADALLCRGYIDGGNDRHPIIPVALPEDRGLPDRSPVLAENEGEYEPAFVEEDQVSPETSNVFYIGPLGPFPWGDHFRLALDCPALRSLPGPFQGLEE